MFGERQSECVFGLVIKCVCRCRCSLQWVFTLAVTLGPFFFSSAWEPLGSSKKNTEATMIVTASKNFIFLSQTRTMKDPKLYVCVCFRSVCCGWRVWASGEEPWAAKIRSQPNKPRPLYHDWLVVCVLSNHWLYLNVNYCQKEHTAPLLAFKLGL